MNSPSSFEPTQQTRITHSRNPILSNDFPIPKTAHPGNPRKTHHLRTLHKNMGGYRGIRPKTGIEKIYFEVLGATVGSFAPSKSTKTWFNFAFICPRSCAFVM